MVDSIQPSALVDYSAVYGIVSSFRVMPLNPRVELSEKEFGAAVDDESVIESSYKLQITKNFTFLPDIQYIRNPASLPNENSDWVIGLRGIWTL